MWRLRSEPALQAAQRLHWTAGLAMAARLLAAVQMEWELPGRSALPTLWRRPQASRRATGASERASPSPRPRRLATRRAALRQRSAYVRAWRSVARLTRIEHGMRGS